MRGQLVLISVSLITICFGVFLAAAFRLVVRPVNFKIPDAVEVEAEVSFTMEIVSADPISRTFTTDWYPTFNPGCMRNTTKVIDVYVDRGALDPSSPAFSISPPYNPVYRFNITAYCRAETSILPAFRVTSKMLHSELVVGFPETQVDHSALQNYPFDIYYAPLYIYGLDPDTGDSATLNITRSFGSVVNFQISLRRSGTLGQWLYFNLKIERSQATRMFVVVVGITNWLMASTFLTICCATLIYHSHKIYSEMFVVPVGAVFAFTTIRTGFPGAPSGFGATIDLFTILPVLVIMSLCSFFLLLAILYRRIMEFKEHDKESQYIRQTRLDGPRLVPSSTSSGIIRRMDWESNFHTRLFRWLSYSL